MSVLPAVQCFARWTETTASQLAWASERLAREPVALARLTEELDGGEGDGY